MNNYKLLAVLLIACFASSGQTARSQESGAATLDETMEWLRPKITHNIVSPSIGGKSSKVKNVEWELESQGGCVLVWNGWKQGKERKRENLLASVRISLSDFVPRRIDSTGVSFNTESYRALGLNTTDDRNTIIWQVGVDSIAVNTLTFKFPVASFSMRPEQNEISERVRRAFTHAITLCGGKQDKPKKPEPF